jgi:hypothetical protein
MWYTASAQFLGLLCGTHRWWTLRRCFHTLSTRVNACRMGDPPRRWFSVCIWTRNHNIMSRWHISTFLSKYIYVFGRLSRKVRRNFYGVDNFSDLLVIEYSSPRFATLVPVHALDVLFQKARFQKLVLHLTNDGVKNLDVWTTSFETGMFHMRGIWFMKEVSESDRQLWNVCWRRNLIRQQR